MIVPLLLRKIVKEESMSRYNLNHIARWLVLSAAAASTAFADTYLGDPDPFDYDPCCAAGPSFTISPRAFHFSYKEFDTDGAVIDQDVGTLPGAQLQLHHPYAAGCGTIDTDYIVNYAYGGARYTGALWGNPFGSLHTDVDEQIFEGEVDVGYTILLSTTCHAGAFVGMGYHHWNRLMKGEGAYDEHYSWIYFPLGLRIDNRFGDCLTLSLEGAYIPTTQGRLKVDLNGGFRLNLGDESGWRIKGAMEYALAQNWSIALAPWYQLSKLGRSELALLTVNGMSRLVSEPPSETKTYGADLTFKYSF